MVRFEAINLLRSKADVNMVALARLYEAFNTRYYLEKDEEVRRMNLDDDYLEPYRLLADLIETNVDNLGD